MTRTRLAAASLFLLACGSGDEMSEEACLTALPLDCQPSLPATYDVLYEQVLAQRCGVSGSGTSCHGRAGFQGGLSLADPETAYTALLASGTGHARVIPGDPACSGLMLRLESMDASYRMPLGENPLSPGVRCALAQWIAAGASKP